MIRTKITKAFHFDAAHNIPNYRGKCERLHGHTYHLEVTLEAPVDPESGIAVDFTELGDLVRREVVDVLDHTYLNERIPVSTAENVASWIFARVAARLPERPGLRLDSIRLWETPTSSVTLSSD